MNARLRRLVTPTPTAPTLQAPTSVTARKGSRETARTVKVSFVASYRVSKAPHYSAKSPALLKAHFCTEGNLMPTQWSRLSSVMIILFATKTSFRVDGEKEKKDARQLRYRSEQWLFWGGEYQCAQSILWFYARYILAGLHPICLTNFLNFIATVWGSRCEERSRTVTITLRARKRRTRKE